MMGEIARLSTLARIRRIHLSEARREVYEQLAAEKRANSLLLEIEDQIKQEFEIARDLARRDFDQQLFGLWMHRFDSKIDSARANCISASARVELARQELLRAKGELNVIEQLLKSRMALARSNALRKELADLTETIFCGSAVP